MKEHLKHLEDMAEFSLKQGTALGADFLTFVGFYSHGLRDRVIDGEVRQPKEVEGYGAQLVVWKNGCAMTQGVRPREKSWQEDISSSLRFMLAILTSNVFPETDLLPPEGPHVGEYDASVQKQVFDPSVAQLSHTNSVKRIREVRDRLESSGLILDGVFNQTVSSLLIATTHGTHQTHTATAVDFTIYAFDAKEARSPNEARLISSFAHTGGHKLSQVDVERISREVIQKCVLQKESTRWNPYTNFANFTGEQYFDVILEPPFIGPILTWLFGYGGFNGKFYLQGESFLSGKMGERVLGDNITVWDDPFNSRGIINPFDWEGVPKKKTLLLEHGVLNEICLDSSLARMIRRKNALSRLQSELQADTPPKHFEQWLRDTKSTGWEEKLYRYETEGQTRSSGHAIPASSAMEWGTMPENIYVEGGTSSIADMIRASRWPTIWITKVHYMGMKHFQTGTITGTAQHGVFLVANGEVVGPVENLRFEMKIPEALRRVTHLGEPQLIGGVLGGESPYVVPPMRIEGFRFIGATARTK